MTNHGGWQGAGVQAAREHIARQLPAPCGICGEPVNPGDPFVVGHKLSRGAFPELTWRPDNWQPEHRRCSDRTGQQGVIEKAKADALRSVGVFPGPQGAFESPPLRNSLSGAGAGLPLAASECLPAPPDSMRWNPGTFGGCKWLQGPFLRVPEGAAAPLAMSPPHPRAVGSYGGELIRWVRESQAVELRWWQRLAVVRALEHDADGALCWRQVLLSASRRSGKSALIRALATWRMHRGPELFGERQLVLHCGSDLAICREVQRFAWRWAETVAGWTVVRSNGKEALATGDGENRWLVKASDATYGYDVTTAIVDEAWDVRPGVVAEGLEPSLLERVSPQLWITSTAHPRATSLMRGRLTRALQAPGDDTLVLLWAAPAGADPGDVATWRAASPYWSADRGRMLAERWQAVVAGDALPESDDLNPLDAFTSQYLNVWQAPPAAVQRGDPAFDPAAWSALTVPLPVGPPDAAAVESWFDSAVSLARAWQRDGVTIVAVSAFDSLSTAAAALRQLGLRAAPVVGSSLAGDPAFRGLRVAKGTGRTGAAVAGLQRLLADDALRHDGGQHLGGQVTAVRTVPSADGLTVTSRHPADAVKACWWAAQAARARGGRRQPRVLLPSGAAA